MIIGDRLRELREAKMLPGGHWKDGAYISQLAKLLGQMTPEYHNLLFAVARKVSKHK